MKQLIKIFLLLFSLWLTGCGQKAKKADVNLSFISGNIASGAGYNGGIMVYGKTSDGVHKFATSFDSSGGNTIIPLRSGTWGFRAIGWVGDDGGKMTGNTHCAIASNVNVTANSETIVDMTLSNATCLNAGFSDSINKEATGHFNKLNLIPCGSINGLSLNPHYSM